MAVQALSDIINELDANYAPSRQLIQQQVDALPQQEQAQQQGLQAQADQAYGDITNAARSRGIGFSGIPIGEQAKYNATTFLPAVANLKTSMNNQKTSLLDSLNQTNLDEQKTALGQYNTEVQNDIAQRAAEAQAAAANASNAAWGSLLGGGQAPATAAPPADKYSSINKQQAANAIVGLLKTNNAGIVSNTLKAIQASAAHGNLYDQFKLELINGYLSPQASGYNKNYANLIKSAQNFRPAAARPAAPANRGAAGFPVVNHTSIGALRPL